MSDWDITTVGLILVGCSIIAVGIIIAAMLLGIFHSFTPFLLLTAIVLVVMGAAVILYVDRKCRQDGLILIFLRGARRCDAAAPRSPGSGNPRNRHLKKQSRFFVMLPGRGCINHLSRAVCNRLEPNIE